MIWKLEIDAHSVLGEVPDIFVTCFSSADAGPFEPLDEVDFQEAYSAKKNWLTLLSSLSRVTADSLCVQMDCSAGP